MFLRLFQLLSTVLGLALATSAGAELIRTAVPRASLNYLSIYAAEAKGFFKDEGLENETIAIGGPAAIAALLSGNVDFSGAGGSGLRAAAKGAELKAIFYQTEKVTWFFVVHPSIKSVADLKGKKIAVGLMAIVKIVSPPCLSKTTVFRQRTLRAFPWARVPELVLRRSKAARFRRRCSILAE